MTAGLVTIRQHEEVTQALRRACGTPGVQADVAGGVRPGPIGVLADLVAGGGVVILSGAGLSTESGIPDYRGQTGRARRAEPMTYQTFVATAAARQRYWARSHRGWRHITNATPNAGHRVVADLERAGLLAGIITQNVDGLHQGAGARQVTELHGSLHRVVCLGCGQRTGRERLDQRLRAANPDWDASPSGLNPDGDAVLAGQGIGIFSDIVVGDELKSGALVKAHGLSLPGYGFYLAHLPNHSLLTIIAAFSAWMRAAA